MLLRLIITKDDVRETRGHNYVHSKADK